ncbi:hypothetical protein V0288_14160 [Pannus brasiliensis CCIBt3594]|uniref:Uncharacterized protein n=1 Tax=Pannus brasiliensis CCIBt3594 TaxID=1427578 RepID=A0AAW9QZ54_9CHRO
MSYIRKGNGARAENIEEVLVNDTVDCARDCVNGCVLGDNCPHREDADRASKFIAETSLDKMLEIAEAARMKKLTEPPKWIIPDDF